MIAHVTDPVIRDNPDAGRRRLRVGPGPCRMVGGRGGRHAVSMEPDNTSSQDEGRPFSGSVATGSAAETRTGVSDRLHRVRRGRMVAGVAAGIADYLGVDPTLVRIGFVALTLMGGIAVPLYLAGWLVIPDEDGGPTVAEELLARERLH